MGFLDNTGLGHFMSKLKAAFFSKTEAIEVVEVDIPTDVVLYTQQSLTDAQKAQARTNIGAGTYSKPSGGIPATDLAPAVQTSLGKADSALQSETDPTVPSWAKASSKPSYNFSEIGSKPTTLSGYGITDAKIQNGTITLGSNTITPLTSFTETDPTVPSWAKQSTKPTYTAQEVGALPSSTPIPSAINDLSDVATGTPTDGDVLTYDSTTGKWVADAPSGGEISTDVVADKADNTKSAGTKAVYDFVKPATGNSIPAGGLLPGVKYRLGTLSGSVTMALAAASDASVENEYKGEFTADSTPPNITWQGVTQWAGNCLDSDTGLPLLTGGKHYEFNIENGYGIIAEFGV